ICWEGADHWFEQMIKGHLGEDTPEDDINGPWDDKIIDYRFLTLWEDERYEKIEALVVSTRAEIGRTTRLGRVISEDCFHPSAALVGGLLLPRELEAQHDAAEILVPTEAVRSNLELIATALKSRQSVLLTGLAGAGKTLLARHIASKLGKLDQMVTLHLNEQSDAKLLTGIYTTGDTPGSFKWKPG
ncbi:AAA ATPase midasin, partial [Teratosphaeriaceae sp. CCFEE 6253]